MCCTRGQPDEGSTLRVGDSVTATIDTKRRKDIASNHTFTHVLNYGLREVSYCTPICMSV